MFFEHWLFILGFVGFIITFCRLAMGGDFYLLGLAEMDAENQTLINLRRGGLRSTEPPLLPIENQRS
jgi:hypothetical protein